MLISDLQDRLRVLVRERIEAGEVTGTELGERAGCRQAHVSNFLNGRRGLSIEAMDRMMASLQLEARDLIGVGRRPNVAAPGGNGLALEMIPLLGMDSPLLERDFDGCEAVEFLYLRKSYLRRFRPEGSAVRRRWRRWVMVRGDKEAVRAMPGCLRPGAMLLLDRHYDSLREARPGEANLYVVQWGEQRLVRYVEQHDTLLLLRPESAQVAVEVVQLAHDAQAADYLLGRVSMISNEV